MEMLTQSIHKNQILYLAAAADEKEQIYVLEWMCLHAQSYTNLNKVK